MEIFSKFTAIIKILLQQLQGTLKTAHLKDTLQLKILRKYVLLLS